MTHPRSISNLRPTWKPGVSGNPGGRPKLPEHLKIIRSLTRHEICKIISKYAHMPYLDLAKQKLLAGLSTVDMAVICVFEQSIEKKDYNSLSFLLDQAIGKPQTIVDEDDDDKQAREELEKLSLQELLRLAQDRLNKDHGPETAA